MSSSESEETVVPEAGKQKRGRKQVRTTEESRRLYAERSKAHQAKIRLYGKMHKMKPRDAILYLLELKYGDITSKQSTPAYGHFLVSLDYLLQYELDKV